MNGMKKKAKGKIIIIIPAVVMFLIILVITATEASAKTIIQNEEAVNKEIANKENGIVSDLDLGDYTERMTVGEKQLLNVTVLPLDSGEKTITYASSDDKVATVNGMGRISALAAGKTIITVMAGQVSQSFELQVVEPENEVILVTDIEIGSYEPELEVGNTMTVSGTVVPSDASESEIKYTSSDTSVATVSSTGEVKGISAGNVSITLTAGSVSKTLELTVKVATAGIKLNSDYLVLKPGEAFKLSAEVMPVEAYQKVSFKSADTSVAAVSSDGLVTAKKTGTTTIIVSNGDISAAVSVIVDQMVNYKEQENGTGEDIKDEVTYTGTVFASEQKIIDSQMLKYLYETKQILKVVGDGYVIEIDGKNIVNYNNIFYTDIFLKKENDALGFVLNQGNELCGEVTLSLDGQGGKYLYLYNESKEKYEQIENVGANELKLTTAGEYQIRTTKLKWDSRVILYILVGGVFIVLIGVGVYIAVKKKYWFW